VLDALRYTPHRTHLSIGEAIRVIETLRPARAYLTHLCHEVDHAELVTSLPAGIWPAYDGLVVDV
jgi:phosphoribosyl 1,2-cyclic phosphate phosphodiesterase